MDNIELNPVKHKRSLNGNNSDDCSTISKKTKYTKLEEFELETHSFKELNDSPNGDESDRNGISTEENSIEKSEDSITEDSSNTTDNSSYDSSNNDDTSSYGSSYSDSDSQISTSNSSNTSEESNNDGDSSSVSDSDENKSNEEETGISKRRKRRHTSERKHKHNEGNKKHRTRLKDIKDLRNDVTSESSMVKIITKYFNEEFDERENEILVIDKRINEVLCQIDKLRGCLTIQYYKDLYEKEANIRPFSKDGVEQRSIHPAMKPYLSKTLNRNEMVMDMPTDHNTPCTSSSLEKTHTRVKIIVPECVSDQMPTLPTENDLIKSKPVGREIPTDYKRTLIIGNVSNYIPEDMREAQYSHKWMIYIRPDKYQQINYGSIENSAQYNNEINFLDKVWFFLHPSYAPNDIVEIRKPPFTLTRYGWGEFPIRVQLHFKDPRNKRIDVIHKLKLDDTLTGMQIQGNETKVEFVLAPPLEEPDKEESFYDIPKIKNSTLTHAVSPTKIEAPPTSYIGYDTSKSVSKTVVPEKRTETPSAGELCAEVPSTSGASEVLESRTQKISILNHNPSVSIGAKIKKYIITISKTKYTVKLPSHFDQKLYLAKAVASIRKSILRNALRDHDFQSSSPPPPLTSTCQSLLPGVIPLVLDSMLLIDPLKVFIKRHKLVVRIFDAMVY